MLSISSQTDCGLIFLTYLAENSGPVSVRTASQVLDLPYKYLGKVAGNLMKAGLVESKEGRNGGYYLAREPAAISLKHVVDALQSSAGPRCLRSDACPRMDRCKAIQVWLDLDQRVAMMLHDYSLKDAIVRSRSHE